MYICGVKYADFPKATETSLKFLRKSRLTTSVGTVQRSYSTRSSGVGRAQAISSWTGRSALTSALTASASTLNMRKDGMEMSLPDPSSAMMGSEVSHCWPPEASMQDTSEQRQVLSAMITPAAPARCALRTCEKQSGLRLNFLPIVMLLH